MMKALVKAHKGPGLELQEIPKPTCKDSNDVLIKIRKTAICGTDLHIDKWDDWASATIPVPLNVGHEFSGVVVEVGANVKHIKVGDRVSGEGHVVCGRCRNCTRGEQHLCPHTEGIGIQRPGAFAEFLCLPSRNVVPIPDDISDDIAAVFDPLGNAVHTAMTFDTRGADVLITGAGPIGIMAALVAKHCGAKQVVITDVNAHRLALAKKVGIEQILDVSKQSLKEATFSRTLNHGFDIGMEMSGNAQALNGIIDALMPGGRIALLGVYAEQEVNTHLNNAIFKGLEFKGIYGRLMMETWYQMMGLIQSGLDVSGVITHHFNYQDFKEAFELGHSGLAGKIILEW